MLARVAGDMAGVIGERLRVLHPNDLDIAIATARGHRHANHFSVARRLLDSIPETLMTDPAHVYLWSDTHYADHHFDRARELIESIDMEALNTAERPGLHRRLGFMIPLRQTAAQMWPAEQQRRLQDARRNDNPLALLTINGREVVLELFEDDAPNSVAAFIAAADLGLYDGYEAGQVHRGFRTIFGDRHEDDGYPAWSLPKESYAKEPRPVLAGNIVGYSDSKPGSADTRFYILQFPAPHLNDRVMTYGRVLTGLDVIREMVQGDVLDSVTIIRRRDHDYDPDVFDTQMQPMKLSELLACPPHPPSG
jgi:peptidyl-prolyl cis-trans isomerase B (cyclophilin B)